MSRLAKVFVILVAGVLAAIAWAGEAGETTATARLSTQLTPLQQKLMSGFASRALEQRSALGLAPRALVRTVSTRYARSSSLALVRLAVGDGLVLEGVNEPCVGRQRATGITGLGCWPRGPAARRGGG